MRDILLDTNALIALLDPGDSLFEKLLMELEAGADFCTNSIAWHEFVRGPISDRDVGRVDGILKSRIHPCTREDGEIAATLWHHGGRRRSSTPDCLIAATTLRLRHRLATRNLQDFERFVELGLQLL